MLRPYKQEFGRVAVVDVEQTSARQLLAVRCPRIVAEPADALDAFAEFLGDWRREPRVYVFQTAAPGIALGCRVQGKQRLPAIPWRARARIEQQVCFCRQPQECGTENLGSASFALAVLFLLRRRFLRQNQPGDEQWIVQIRQRVVEALLGVNGLQRG